MIAFLEYMLNTLGSSGTPVRDKEVLITQSYAKIFRDAKVQVEDDLDAERRVITNKDVVAYLKDVNFFFKNVRFEFTIDAIENRTLPNGEYFYKVSTTRNLTGTTAESSTVNNTQVRYIEINYNPNDQDLKIVSMYTNEFNEREALTRWWKELSYEWQSLFKQQVTIKDSVRLSDIKNITTLQTLDISNNTFIQSIEPLAQLLNLQSLNVSGTSVSDLTPIRNLTELTELNLSNTRIKDLTALRYSDKMQKLILANVHVEDISVLIKMPELQELDLRSTKVIDFAPLSALSNLRILNLRETQVTDLSSVTNLMHLEELDISRTAIQTLDPLKQVTTLQVLAMDSTQVKSVATLTALVHLKILHANYTPLVDLSPLQELPSLEKIYCDHTRVQQSAVDLFIAKSPKVLVIFASKDIQSWWNSLSAEWQTVISRTTGINAKPSNEELAILPNLDSINIGGNDKINSLEPLRRLTKLEVVIVSKTGITNLEPLHNHLHIRYLDVSETNVADISPLGNFSQLKILKADNSKIERIENHTFPSLETLYADHTTIHDLNAQEFLVKNPTVLLIFKTVHLTRWWTALPESLKDAFRKQVGAHDTLTREQLHTLVEKKVVRLSEVPISDLSSLSEFVQLQELYVSGTFITELKIPENIKSLKTLHVTSSPIQEIESLGTLSTLEDLDLSNTPIEDLEILWRLKQLKKLNCSGTQIKKLGALAALEKLEHLDCSNTNVTKLDALDYLPLKTLRCYNTRVSNREIEKFKASHPDCNVVYYR